MAELFKCGKCGAEHLYGVERHTEYYSEYFAMPEKCDVCGESFEMEEVEE